VNHIYELIPAVDEFVGSLKGTQERPKLRNEHVGADNLIICVQPMNDYRCFVA
jgi:hypothetical protein